MFCDRCGASVDAAQNFCPSCGKPMMATASGPSESPVIAGPGRRVTDNNTVLGILWLVYSGLGLLPGLFMMFLSQTASSFMPPDVPRFVPALLQGIGFGLTVFSGLGVVAGWGLLTWKSWARMLSIVLGVIHLLSFPFGTALGIYTLWVLLPAESEREYRQRVLATV